MASGSLNGGITISDEKNPDKMASGIPTSRGPWSINDKNRKTFSSNKLVCNMLKDKRNEMKAHSINHAVYQLLFQEQRVEELKQTIQEKNMELKSYRRVVADITDARNELATDLVKVRMTKMREEVKQGLYSLSFDTILRQIGLEIPKDSQEQFFQEIGNVTWNCGYHVLKIGGLLNNTYVATLNNIQNLILQILAQSNGKD